VLAIDNITTGYGNSQVLFGMSLENTQGRSFYAARP